MNKIKVGFIGLGLMGAPMAKNIYKSGFPLTVYNRRLHAASLRDDRSPLRLKDFKKLKGVSIAKSPKEVAENSDIVITMVTAPKDVQEVILGKDGVIEGVHKDLIVVDMSTIGPTAAKEIAKALKKKGVPFIDAPVTGSTEKATDGTLTILAGGERQIFDRVKPVLETMGKDVFYIGTQGEGQAIKLVNNMMVAITITALAEGMLEADALGLDREKVMQFLGNVPGVSYNMKMKMPNMVKGKHPVAFSMANMRKDLRLALDESGEKSFSKTQVLAVVEKLYKKGMDLGLGENDISAVLEVLSRK